jgi:hypothetical protein
MKNPLHYIQAYPNRTKQILVITFKQFQNLVAQAQKSNCFKQLDLSLFCQSPNSKSNK